MTAASRRKNVLARARVVGVRVRDDVLLCCPECGAPAMREPAWFGPGHDAAVTLHDVGCPALTDDRRPT